MKRRTKKLVALGMTAAMTAGLIAGCGKKATPESLLTDMAKNLAEVESLMANIGVGMEMTDGTDTMGLEMKMDLETILKTEDTHAKGEMNIEMMGSKIGTEIELYSVKDVYKRQPSGRSGRSPNNSLLCRYVWHRHSTKRKRRVIGYEFIRLKEKTCVGGHRMRTCGDVYKRQLEDLKNLEAQGVEILTCGTCLDYYGLKEKLQVGSVTNMYAIMEAMNRADKIIRP